MGSNFKRMVSKITKEDAIYEYLCYLRELAHDFNLSDYDRQNIITAYPGFQDADWLFELKDRCSTHYTVEGMIRLKTITDVICRNNAVDLALADAFIVLCDAVCWVNGEINKCSHLARRLDAQHELLSRRSNNVFGKYYATTRQLCDCHKQLARAYDKEKAIGKTAVGNLFSWNQQLLCLFQTGSNRCEINTSRFLTSYLRTTAMQSAIALRHCLAPTSDYNPDSLGRIIYNTVWVPYHEGLNEQRAVTARREAEYHQCAEELRKQIQDKAYARK